MPGGLMQLVSEGQQNIILNGNPSKTFFKSTYKKFTNFGLQRFRVDFEGAKTLQLNEQSFFTFKIPRYADLLMDCYLSIDLPNIWSPIVPPNPDPTSPFYNEGKWVPYEFKWIEYLGAQLISNIQITCGNQLIQEYSGDYLLASVLRDYSEVKKKLFFEMIGHVPALYEPANSGSRVNAYPNAFFTTNSVGAEPSILGRTLYIPLNAWFNNNTQTAFPLTSLQYNYLQIQVTLRPIQELIQIRDVFDYTNNFPYVAPNFNQYYMQMYRFLQTPPDIELGPNSYTDQRSIWNADIHLLCTYGFLSDEEQRIFATQEQNYLFKQVRRQIFYNVTGPNKIELNSLGMVSNWTFYFQRSDVNLRNEWSNWTNWPYSYMPNDLLIAPTQLPISSTSPNSNPGLGPGLGPGVNSDGRLTGWYITGNYNIENVRDIMVSMGVLLDGIYRENVLPAGVFNYVEKWARTSANAPNGLYVYAFCLNTDIQNLQPSGAMNMSRFTNIELETTTVYPPLDPLAQTLTICDPNTGAIVGVNKPTWRIYQYNYNLVLFEERINMVSFVGGNCGLLYAT